jgi:hypothetical protein
MIPGAVPIGSIEDKFDEDDLYPSLELIDQNTALLQPSLTISSL